MTAGWNSGHTFSTPPELTTIDDLLFILMQRNACSNRQNIRFRPWLVLVVEAYRAVGPEIVGVSCFRRITAFDAVHPTASYHFALAVYHEIDFLRGRVVVRPVRSSRGKIHPEEAVHH